MGDKHNIYHYTATEGLKNILRKKELWFTNIQYLNDYEEVKFGLNTYNQYNRKKFEVAELINTFESSPYDISAFHAYVCCFSVEKDALPMWNYYTKDTFNKGYNIGFDYRKLIASLLLNNPELNGCGCSFGKVNYCLESVIDDKEESEKLTQESNYVEYASEYSNNMLSVMDKCLFEKPPKNDKLNQIQNELKVINLNGRKAKFDTCHTMEVVLFMKKKYFEHENEFRIVITVPNNIISQFIKHEKYDYRNLNGILTPYIKLKFDQNAFLGIKASPTNNGELVDKSIYEYCDFCGIEAKKFPEGITHSKIPVRF